MKYTQLTKAVLMATMLTTTQIAVAEEGYDAARMVGERIGEVLVNSLDRLVNKIFTKRTSEDATKEVEAAADSAKPADNSFKGEYSECNSILEGQCIGEGLIAFMGDNEKYGIMNEYGELLINPKFDRIEPFSEGLALVVSKDKYGFIDKTGKVIIPIKYENASGFSEGLAGVQINKRIGYIDKNDRMVIKPMYDLITAEEFNLEPPQFADGVVVLQKNGKSGMLDKTGKVVIPFRYSIMGEGFSEGLIVAADKKGYGYLNKFGQVVIPLKYDHANNFSEGLAGVCEDRRLKFIDKTGQIIIDDLNSSCGANREDDSGEGFFTYYGEYFQDGKAIVSNVDGVGYHYIDKKGRYLGEYNPY